MLIRICLTGQVMIKRCEDDDLFVAPPYAPMQCCRQFWTVSQILVTVNIFTLAVSKVQILSYYEFLYFNILIVKLPTNVVKQLESQSQ